jgi:hypothetical protein
MPACLPFFRGQGLHGEGVDVRLHALAQCPVDELVAGDPEFAAELGADDDGLEVVAIALDMNMFAG